MPDARSNGFTGKYGVVVLDGEVGRSPWGDNFMWDRCDHCLCNKLRGPEVRARHWPPKPRISYCDPIQATPKVSMMYRMASSNSCTVARARKMRPHASISL